MNNHWIEKVLARPKLVIVVSIIFMLLAALGSKNLYFRGDYKVFFKDDNPQRLAYEQMQERFTKNESVSIVISVEDGTQFTQERLAMIKDLSDASWQIPLSTRVDSLTNFQHTYSDEGDLIVEDLLMDIDDLDNNRIALIESVSLNEPDLVDKLISSNGKVSMINVNILLPDGDQTAVIQEVSDYVRNMVAPYQQQYPDVQYRLSGIVFMTDAMFLAALHDVKTLFPAMFILISILIAVLMRSVWATVATLIIIFTSIIATLGLGGWFGMFMNIATANVPVIIMTLAIADSVHVISSLRYYMQQGDKKSLAIQKSLKLNTPPIIMTSLTTAIGFLTLNFAEVPVLSDLGNLVAIGVIIACLFSLILLPALLLALPISFKKEALKEASPWEKMAKLTINYSRPIVLTGLVLIIGSAFLASKNELNDIAIEYFNKSNTFRQSADFQQDNLSGLTNIDFALYTNKDNEINSPEYLRLIEEFTAWLLLQEEVDHVLSYSNTIKRLSKNVNDDDIAFEVIPENRELAAQYLLLYEMSLPFGLDTNNQIDLRKSAVRVMVTIQNLGSSELTAFEDKAKAWMNNKAPQYTLEAASIPLIFAHIGKANMEGMIKGGVVALLLISGLLLFALRSVKLGLISIIPNLLPALMGFAVWALISAEISMALSVVMTMTLGIIVDDTVHFLSKYKKSIDSGSTPNEAIMFAFNNVGNALLITTIVLASGFTVLAFSGFALNSDMGTLTAIIIVLALIVDLLLLPAMLSFGQKKSRSSSR
ncbi:efflux RND transporter permease subunit [Glaciecola sp. 2405UD65-10]|uniref:efflux RND transporter permease subunit n=1 Tax=Glaciecola sp. 2405UD65-10 TaxID=3397244 RepID=UPI003B5BBDA9